MKTQLIAKIKLLCRRCLAVANPIFDYKPAAALVPSRGRPANARVDIVAIGVSTGGPNALGRVLPRLPAHFPVPIVIVQHMLPLFTRLLAERLVRIPP